MHKNSTGLTCLILKICSAYQLFMIEINILQRTASITCENNHWYQKFCWAAYFKRFHLLIEKLLSVQDCAFCFFTFRKRCYLLAFLVFWQTFSSASGWTEGKCSYTNYLWLIIKEQEKFCFQCKWGNLYLRALGNSDFPVFISILIQRKNTLKVIMKQKILKAFEPEMIICFNFPLSILNALLIPKKDIFYLHTKWMHFIWFMLFLLPVTGTLPCRHTLHCIIWCRMKTTYLREDAHWFTGYYWRMAYPYYESHETANHLGKTQFK